MTLPKTLKFARVDGLTVSFPIVWTTLREFTVPTLSVDNDEYLSDFVGHDIMPRVQYLWIDGNGITSADETSIDADEYIGTYTLI